MFQNKQSPIPKKCYRLSMYFHQYFTVKVCTRFICNINSKHDISVTPDLPVT